VAGKSARTAISGGGKRLFCHGRERNPIQVRDRYPLTRRETALL
jgi:hypothetical protein